MKKRLPIICICISNLIFCLGCADVPSEVQQEISVLDGIEQQNQSSVTEKSEMQYQTLEEIRASAQLLEGRNTGILRVLGTPVIASVDSMPIYKVSSVTLSDSKTEVYFSHVKDSLEESLNFSLPKPQWDHYSEPCTEISVQDQDGNIHTENMSSYQWMYYIDGLCALREDESASLGISTHGAVCNFWQNTDPPVYYTNLITQKTVPVGYDNSVLSESFSMMNDEEWSLSDAKKFAEDYFNSTFGDWCGKVSFVVKEIRVLKLPDSGFGYDITLQQIYDDKIPLLPLGRLHYQNDSSGDVLFGKTCSMWCVVPNRVQNFSMNGLYSIGQGEETDKLLTAESALAIVSEALAQKKVHSVYMELGYAGMVSGSKYMQITGNCNDLYFVLQNGDFASCTAMPYWFIWEPVEGMKSRMSGNYYMVNALTGELEIL